MIYLELKEWWKVRNVKKISLFPENQKKLFIFNYAGSLFNKHYQKMTIQKITQKNWNIFVVCTIYIKLRLFGLFKIDHVNSLLTICIFD